MAKIKTQTKIRNASKEIGKWAANRASAAFWDSLYARNDNDLKDLIAWAQEMSETNCGWQDYRLKQAFIYAAADILKERNRNKS